MGYAYILRCRDESYYVGSTTHLYARLAAHQRGEAANYTRKRLPVELVWAAEFANIAEAFHTEQRIKRWSRAKKEALIEGRVEDLAHLAWGLPFPKGEGRH